MYFSEHVILFFLNLISLPLFTLFCIYLQIKQDTLLQKLTTTVITYIHSSVLCISSSKIVLRSVESVSL